MGTADGAASSELMMGPFVGSIRCYSLFQAIDLCCKWLAQTNQLDEDHAYQLISFAGNTSLAFPKGDIEDVSFYLEHGVIRAKFVINSINLFGTGSPLPAHYCEPIAYDDEQGRVIRDFMDLFNHRLQVLIYPIWKKYRYYVQFKPAADDMFSARMFALIGLGYPELRSNSLIEWSRLLPYLGLLSIKVQSAALLEAVLRYYFNHKTLMIEQCVIRQITIPAAQRNCLGVANHRVSQSLLLGDRIADRQTSFRIHICELDWDTFHYFLPIGKGYVVLRQLVEFILREPLAYDLSLSMPAQSSQAFVLSENNKCRLGWTTWFGLYSHEGTVTITGNINDNY
ncbi:type VI secretion system baseplate subunit TssG [Tolumonas lignilytica]|uniref:type VI secretion system baseplate subunit TssG n=1 Tax=Tolumonas lignilytica TaxID=1283284 RepID=UPI00046336E0|nr:type VI secretion system baseplate subunit TssG [Tolumonas lignilytica]